MDCIESGFYSSVMIDASHEDFDKNIAITKQVVDAAHARGIVVEAELGQLGGVEEHVAVDEANAKLTDPNTAKEFVERSGCDSLAVAIGTSHGAFKFSGARRCAWTCSPRSRSGCPGFPLVMHGSSSVPQEEVERINKAGGSLKGAKGVDADQFLRAAQIGRDQDQYRYRRPPGVDARAPRIFQRASRRDSICARLARSSWPNMPSSSLIRTRNWAAPGSLARWRCWLSNLRCESSTSFRLSVISKISRGCPLNHLDGPLTISNCSSWEG